MKMGWCPIYCPLFFLNNFQLGTETFPIVGVGYYFFSLEKGFVPKY